MSDLQTAVSFEELLNASFVEIKTREVVKGKVIEVTPNEIIVNIGYKADGVLTKEEYSNNQSIDLTDHVKVGESIETLVMRVNDRDGVVNLSRKRILMNEGYKAIKVAYENKEKMSGIVSEVVKGGVIVVKFEVPIFIPQSRFDIAYREDLHQFVGQEISFVITEFNERRRKVVGNRRVLLQVEHDKKVKEALENINVGDRILGTVKSLTKYGAFVDLNGVDGLLHISEMSWGIVTNPMQVVKEGQEVNVLVKECDKEKKKIALSLKFPEENPWNNAEDKFAEGNVVTGKVARLTDFGAFIEIEKGVDALLHVSQISVNHVKQPADVLSVGDEVTAKVTLLNLDERKIGLSVKELELEKQQAESQEA
ncbi:30S ribosomal protein S1 [Vallitalea okinawensis]|uniref:30S ribosomal protein S1 n=1 Tax=Vallitalea okinawensis TaxID=2078660 RepID=UPI0014782399|nr:S1 RNA-binding domain-containing protein [Vallitalea okinawensis]